MLRADFLAALLALTQAAKLFPRIQTGRVAVSPRELEGIRTNLFGVLQNVFAGELGLRERLIGTKQNRFALTSRTRALIAEGREGNYAQVTVVPRDPQLLRRIQSNLTRNHDVLLERKKRTIDQIVLVIPTRDFVELTGVEPVTS